MAISQSVEDFDLVASFAFLEIRLCVGEDCLASEMYVDQDLVEHRDRRDSSDRDGIKEEMAHFYSPKATTMKTEIFASKMKEDSVMRKVEGRAIRIEK